jgi:phosphoenolpyruvate synthase/pyruvate phosphate dikinase
MRYITDTEWDAANKAGIGGKAKNLFVLKKLGFRVPKFIVIPFESFEECLIDENSPENDASRTRQISLSPQFIENLIDNFADVQCFAVRSSAIEEDGENFSFAGQFESFLFVTKNQLPEKIKQVWTSGFSARVNEYRTHHNLPESQGIAVIVQEMIDASISGVAFGIHPVTGNPDQKLINAVFGLGEGLVSGELNADSFLVENGRIKEELTSKPYQIVGDHDSGGIKKKAVEDSRQNISTLDGDAIQEICNSLDKLQNHLEKPQDIEFAIRDNQLFLLQTRPVTRFYSPTRSTGNYILWDNSNIIESYPGVTTPLTFSFISKSYEIAYKLFSSYLGVSDKVIMENERVFAHTLGFINGRVYYNLKTWHHMLAMLPGYSINARFMEKMMGVKEQFDIPESYRLSKGKAWWSIGKMAVNMYSRFRSLPQKRKEFVTLLNKTIAHYKHIDYSEKTINELVELYLNFEQSLLNEWKAPLLNDFFAMIWFGMLQKNCEKFSAENPNLHNDLLCGSSDIISVEPVHRSIALATHIGSNPVLKELFTKNSEAVIWNKLKSDSAAPFSEIRKQIDSYIADFGERCVGELKLETVSYTQDPARFVRVLKSYVESGVSKDQFSGKTENELRSNAEMIINQTLSNSPFQRWKFNKILSNARELVSARENLRYERTRAFGIVREIFSALGVAFHREHIIENERDIFYLTKDEILAYVEGTAVSQDFKGLISFRKKEFQKFTSMEPPSERFATFGPVYQGNDFFSNSRVEIPEGDLKGIGCSPGIVRGKVRVVMDPHETHALNGDILVTTSTDPGWVTLFTSASGIIVERGSLLSHSAIVSREMGKPCIVAVTGLLKKLKTGDQIEMNGSTGTIRVINE